MRNTQSQRSLKKLNPKNLNGLPNQKSFKDYLHGLMSSNKLIKQLQNKSNLQKLVIKMN